MTVAFSVFVFLWALLNFCSQHMKVTPREYGELCLNMAAINFIISCVAIVWLVADWIIKLIIHINGA